MKHIAWNEALLEKQRITDVYIFDELNKHLPLFMFRQHFCIECPQSLAMFF